MRVCVSVLGRFNAFDLARGLHARGALDRLITSYPKFAAKRFGVPRQRTRSILSSELLRRGWTHVPPSWAAEHNPQGYICEHFDRRAARHVPEDADVFVGWSGSTLHGLRRASELGLATVVERLSTHMDVQCRLMREEYEQFGFRPRVAHPAVVEKELAEYVEADVIHVPSEFVRRSFLEEGVAPERVVRVPFGVSLDAFTPPEPGAREHDRTFRILHVGGVSLRKGCHYLLEAFQRLNLPDAELRFVGNVAPEMEAFRERYASGSIVFQDAIPQSELVHEYARAHVFALASIEEGLAMVTLQAMACGLPVVATTNTGAEDVVDDGREGFIVPIRDPEALAERLLWLYEHRDAAREMGRLAEERVRESLSWTDHADRKLGLYRRLVEETGRGTNHSASVPGRGAA